MVFGFFWKRKKEEKPRDLSVKELNRLLKEGKYKKVTELLKDRYRENKQFLEIYFTALVESGKIETAKKLLEEV
ncbi:MAG TPA: tetratricopeptide repeat protein, partial [Aquifex sp.]|nr:tetratricopeptide repeat protein [Aquifex sp.]